MNILCNMSKNTIEFVLTPQRRHERGFMEEHLPPHSLPPFRQRAKEPRSKEVLNCSNKKQTVNPRGAWRPEGLHCRRDGLSKLSSCWFQNCNTKGCDVVVHFIVHHQIQINDWLVPLPSEFQFQLKAMLYTLPVVYYLNKIIMLTFIELENRVIRSQF